MFDNRTPDEEYVAQFVEQQDKLYEAQQDLFRVANAHATLYGTSDTREVLIGNGMGREAATYLLSGYFKAKNPRAEIRTEAINAFKVIDPDNVVTRVTGLEKMLAAVVDQRNGSSLYKEDFKTPYQRDVSLPVIDKETGQRIQREASPAFLDLLEDQERLQRKAKGGEVLNVPNASVEPDQRIDKMTGMPYDQQAGTAFVDEEDPLRRMGFVGGGNVDPLRRLGFGKGGSPKGKEL